MAGEWLEPQALSAVLPSKHGSLSPLGCVWLYHSVERSLSLLAADLSTGPKSSAKTRSIFRSCSPVSFIKELLCLTSLSRSLEEDQGSVHQWPTHIVFFLLISDLFQPSLWQPLMVKKGKMAGLLWVSQTRSLCLEWFPHWGGTTNVDSGIPNNRRTLCCTDVHSFAVFFYFCRCS